MIKILNGAIYDEFMHSIDRSEKNISLCAPFIKESIMNDILTYKKDNVNIKTITSIKLMSFYRKVLDLGALTKVLDSSGEVFNYPLLHAKFYLFDNKKLIITSSNLTESGLRINKEYGIVCDNIDLVQTATSDFNKMCVDDKASKIKYKHLTDIQNLINSLPKEIKIGLPKYGFENEEIYSYKIIQEASSFQGWKKDIYDIIVKLSDDYFELKDFNNYIPNLMLEHPKNNCIEAKIRQVLQQLRNIGLIRFEGNGKYMRLFK